MRAGRLLSLMLLLERRGRLTAAELAAELEVSIRTVLRDVDALSGAGVPIYATRGRNGGFELLEGFRSNIDIDGWSHATPPPGRPRRATVRVSPEGRRVAAVLGVLQPLRVRRTEHPDVDGWQTATFRLGTIESTARDVLSIGPDIEVIEPTALRTRVIELVDATRRRYLPQR